MEKLTSQRKKSHIWFKKMVPGCENANKILFVDIRYHAAVGNLLSHQGKKKCGFSDWDMVSSWIIFYDTGRCPAIAVCCISTVYGPHPVFRFSDAQREQYRSLESYIQNVVVPDMQKKLQVIQGFGRAIRTEQDTCVVSILDGLP